MRVNLTPAFVAKKAEPPVTGDRTISGTPACPASASSSPNPAIKAIALGPTRRQALQAHGPEKWP